MFITISAVGYFQGDEIVYFDRIKDEVIILVLEKERKAKYRQKNQDLLPKLIQSIEWNKEQRPGFDQGHDLLLLLREH
jgi:hypothetical protein